MGKSTGPRTPRGKARSSRNAAKHWIESGRILPEEQKEATNLRSGFTSDFNPEGLIENEVIDDLTFNRLIKRRIDMAFTREFSIATVARTVRLIENNERSATHYWLRTADGGSHFWAERGVGARLRPDACIAGLEMLKKRIAVGGPQPQDLETLRRYYGAEPTELAACAMYQMISIAAKQSSVQGQSAGETEVKELVETLESEIESQKNRGELAEAALKIETASDLQEPEPPALDTLLRYRSANIREFKDLLDCLERIRRLKGTTA